MAALLSRQGLGSVGQVGAQAFQLAAFHERKPNISDLSGLLDVSCSYDSLTVCSSPGTPTSADPFAHNTNPIPQFNPAAFMYASTIPTPSPPQPLAKAPRLAPSMSCGPELSANALYSSSDLYMALPSSFPPAAVPFSPSVALLPFGDRAQAGYPMPMSYVPLAPQGNTKQKPNPISPKPLTAEVAVAPAPMKIAKTSVQNGNKSDSGTGGGSVKKHTRRPRTKEQLEKCRQESARARERKKHDRLRLDQLISDKTDESKQLKQQVITLENEVQNLRQYVLSGALNTLQTQPPSATASLATQVIAYVSQLLQGSCALAPQRGPLVNFGSPSAKPALLREIRPRDLEEDEIMEGDYEEQA